MTRPNTHNARHSSRDVVITGVGVVSPYGVGLPSFVEGMKRGQSCAAPITQFDASTFSTTIAAEVPTPADITDWVRAHLSTEDTRHQRLLADWHTQRWLDDRKVAFALIAAQEAWTMAGGDHTIAQTTWNTIALGLERAFLEDFNDTLSATQGIDWHKERDIGDAHPTTARLRTRVDLAHDALSAWFSWRGPRVAHVSACAAGGISIAHAAQLIQRGQADIVACGASDAMINPLGLGGMSRLGAPSPRNTIDACKPFDRHRDGLLMGEGAAVFVLESREHAEQRGASPVACVRGWATTQDGWRTTAPRPDGAHAARAMQGALRRASCEPTAIDYINAHGTGTPLNDVAETQAIYTALGEHAKHVRVSSTKGAIGHAMAASGALEALASILPLWQGGQHLWPMTTNLTTPDPACPLNFIVDEPIHAPAQTTLSNSFGFGGQNVSLIFGRA